jgi:hypothetical protein
MPFQVFQGENNYLHADYMKIKKSICTTK